MKPDTGMIPKYPYDERTNKPNEKGPEGPYHICSHMPEMAL